MRQNETFFVGETLYTVNALITISEYAGMALYCTAGFAIALLFAPVVLPLFAFCVVSGAVYHLGKFIVDTITHYHNAHCDYLSSQSVGVPLDNGEGEREVKREEREIEYSPLDCGGSESEGWESEPTIERWIPTPTLEPTSEEIAHAILFEQTSYVVGGNIRSDCNPVSRSVIFTDIPSLSPIWEMGESKQEEQKGDTIVVETPPTPTNEIALVTAANSPTEPTHNGEDGHEWIDNHPTQKIPPLESLTVVELKALAAMRKIKIPSKTKKAEIVALLKDSSAR